MAMYESEHTKFIREWLQAHPEEVAEQKRGRALWWDKQPISPDTQQRSVDATIPAKAYYYDSTEYKE